MESNAARARYLAHFGCRHLKVNLSGRVGAENLSLENGKTLAKNLNEVGKRTAAAGIKFAFHPHAWTLVERQPELDMVMEMTDPTLVYLVLDTGHATLGGIDPVQVSSRLLLPHRGDPSQGRGSRNTRPPAAGRVRRRAKRNTRRSISTSASERAAWTSRPSSRCFASAIMTAG